ncbi:CPBP family intramembrane glutamic endopeptidase [Williamsia sp.]|uniref:CPBP family intramembrane glutamic endopeptidase n=1 Tax=Williamsia sp. TaxID=1872085 RepID=UPI002F927567
MRDVAVVVGVLALINVLSHFTFDHAITLFVPLGAIGLLIYARWRGFGWDELGLARSQHRKGLRWAAAILIPVAVIAIGGALLPWTRSLYLSDHYDSVSVALWGALVIIPLQTVIPEELLFRGVLNAALVRVASVRVVYLAGAGLFGLWHVSSSLGLTAGNDGLTDLLGSGLFAQIAGVAGAVIVTGVSGLIFIWLRRRSDSLLAPMAFHWAVNGTGALGAALAWQLQ